MKSILLKAAAASIASMVASLALAAILLPAMGGDFSGNAVLMSALCPLLIAFPASGVTFWHNERLRDLHARLNDAHAALAQAHAKLSDKSRRDGMTGLLNRETFFGVLDKSRRRSGRGSLLLVDADHFKSINDRFGHLVGDKALLEIVAAISRSVRDVDVIGRIGGEEFAVFLTGADIEEANRIGERIRREVEAIRFMPAQEGPLSLTVSVGGAICWTGASVSELMRAADRRLYQAKNAGRNRVVLDVEQRWAA